MEGSWISCGRNLLLLSVTDDIWSMGICGIPFSLKALGTSTKSISNHLWFSGVDAICCFIYGYDAKKYIAWDYFCLVFMEASADASRRRWQEGNEVVLADFGAVVPYTENRNLSCCPDRSGIAVS